ncbi:MAG: protein-ADP-ribose hydrolase [Lachnospiraceae bacterium]|nr:protein-ADP-ribose hydrolase [Lachnospiraceae bacterium]
MTQDERRIYLIRELLSEEKQYRDMEIPADEQQQKQLLRALFNIRMPKPVSPDFLEVQDQYLQEELRQKGITDVADLTPVQDGIYLWQGDITTLRCGAIVNAANSQMLGCFCPNHGCIDNAIHTYAGIQLRSACAEMMARQGQEEPEEPERRGQLHLGEARTGEAKITPAFNLPCDYVIHTVGPIVTGRLTVRDKELLASCYRSCLELAEQNGIRSIAFCCISTGEFHFPNERAAEIAVNTVKEYKEQTHSEIEVIFNVFKDNDLQIYRNLLR